MMKGRRRGVRGRGICTSINILAKVPTFTGKVPMQTCQGSLPVVIHVMHDRVCM